VVTPRAPFVRPSPLTRCTRFLHQVIRGDAGGISGDFSDRPPAEPRVRRGSISRDSKSGGQKTRTRRDIAIGASLFRAGFSRIVRLLAPDDPGLALAATTLAAAALAAASTAAATDTSITAPSFAIAAAAAAVVAAAAVAVAAAAVAATFVVAAAAAAVATATYIRRPAAQTQAQAQGCTSTCS